MKSTCSRSTTLMVHTIIEVTPDREKVFFTYQGSRWYYYQCSIQRKHSEDSVIDKCHGMLIQIYTVLHHQTKVKTQHWADVTDIYYKRVRPRCEPFDIPDKTSLA